MTNEPPFLLSFKLSPFFITWSLVKKLPVCNTVAWRVLKQSSHSAAAASHQQRCFQQGTFLLVSDCITLPEDTSSIHSHSAPPGAWLYDITPQESTGSEARVALLAHCWNLRNLRQMLLLHSRVFNENPDVLKPPITSLLFGKELYIVSDTVDNVF